MSTHQDWATLLTHADPRQVQAPFVPTMRVRSDSGPAHHAMIPVSRNAAPSGDRARSGSHRQPSKTSAESAPNSSADYPVASAGSANAAERVRSGGSGAHLATHRLSPDGAQSPLDRAGHPTPHNFSSNGATKTVHGSGPRGSTDQRQSSVSHGDDVTQPRQESRRGRSQASASVGRDAAVRFSPSTPKKPATTTHTRDNDGGVVGGEREKISRSRSVHAQHRSPLLDSHASLPASALGEAAEDNARLALQQKLASRAGRREPPAHVGPTSEAPTNSASRRRSSPQSAQRAASPKPKRAKVWCGQNKWDPRLRSNGGDLEPGTRAACTRQGFGAALYQNVENEEEFIRKFSVKYEPYVSQKLWYKNSPVPYHEGYQPATLSQCRLRGWGAGSAELARRLRAKLHEASARSSAR